MTKVINFTTDGYPSLQQVGGKGLSLIQMTREGFPVPPGFVLTITREGDGLIGQATGQGPIPLEPRGDDVFAVPQVGAVLTFQRDADGRVDRIRLEQGGQEMVGPRQAP